MRPSVLLKAISRNLCSTFNRHADYWPRSSPCTNHLRWLASPSSRPFTSGAYLFQEGRSKVSISSKTPKTLDGSVKSKESDRIEPNSDPEFIKRYKTFWHWFQTNADRLKTVTSVDDDLFAELQERLEDVQSNLVCEFEEGDEGWFHFVVSAEGNFEHFPTVLGLVAAHPRDLEKKKFRIIAFKQRQNPLPEEGIQMGSVLIQFRDIEVAAFSSESGDDARLSLELRVLDGSKRNQSPIPSRRYSKHIQQMAFIMLSHVVGEFDVHMRISGVDFVDHFDPNTKPDVMPLVELPQLIDAHFGQRVSPWPTG